MKKSKIPTNEVNFRIAFLDIFPRSFFVSYENKRFTLVDFQQFEKAIIFLL